MGCHHVDGSSRQRGSSLYQWPCSPYSQLWMWVRMCQLPRFLLKCKLLRSSFYSSKTSINAQENKSRNSDFFCFDFSRVVPEKAKSAAFSKIKTTRRIALFLSTFSRLTAAGRLKKLASIKASVSFPAQKRKRILTFKGWDPTFDLFAKIGQHVLNPREKKASTRYGIGYGSHCSLQSY